MRNDELETAESYFNQALKQCPEYPAAWLGLTEFYLAQDDLEKAQEAYQKYKEHGGKPVPDYEEIATP